MAFIRLLDRDIAPEELGFTYSHEHIVCVPPHWAEHKEDDLLLDDPEKSAGDLALFKSLGGKTVVDATAVDYGRRVTSVYEISKKTGVQILGTAGFNKGFLWDAKRPDANETFQQWIERSTLNELTDFVIGEVEKGMDGTKLRGGQVKCGTGYNSISPLEEKTVRAVARAQLQTKAPLHCHTEAGTMALEQIAILREEGVELPSVSFGHMDRNPDPWMYRKVAETGAYLCFDGIGKIKYYAESVRTASILQLVRDGFREQILISGDLARKSYYASYNYGIGLGFILSKWIPRFIEEAHDAGFDGKSLVDDFFINNPKKCFSFKG
ncbi:phosphotriesterase [Spirochaetia bacterium]|nr:phosphotriesterase [Spirochaetia bacterium]